MFCIALYHFFEQENLSSIGGTASWCLLSYLFFARRMRGVDREEKVLNNKVCVFINKLKYEFYVHLNFGLGDFLICYGDKIKRVLQKGRELFKSWLFYLKIGKPWLNAQWIISCEPKEDDVDRAFQVLAKIDWRQSRNIVSVILHIFMSMHQ